MKEWTRARRFQRCGLCGGELQAGDPIRVYTMRDGIELLRCGPCEGGAPADLPAVVESAAAPARPLDFTRIGVLPLDFSHRRLGEREPGEDG